MLVRNMLTLNPLVVTANDPISLAAQYMRDRKVGVLPVVASRAERRLIGVITDRDIVVRCGRPATSRELPRRRPHDASADRDRTSRRWMSIWRSIS